MPISEQIQRLAQLQDRKDFTQFYNTPIPPTRQAEFDVWAKTARGIKDMLWDRPSYDVQGAWLADQLAGPGKHGSDVWKKPSHITFSDESMYSTPQMTGGKWRPIGEESGPWSFTPSPFNLWVTPVDVLKKYFREREPKSELILPGTKRTIRRLE